MKVRKAIIPAAGLGTRFLLATKAQPKEMLPIVDKPTIQYIIEEAVASGIEDIIIISGRGKQTIENHFDRSIELEMELEKTGKTDYLKMVREIADMANVHYIRQKQPRGLGHAVLVAKQFIGDEPFAVLLGDDIVVSKTPCLGQMIEQFEECQSSILGVQTVPEEVVNKYGIIDDRILNAICYHTTGRPNMTNLEKIIFISDYVEEKTRVGECFEVARKAANKNLNDAIVVIIEQTIAYLKKNNKPVYQLTEETYQFYLKEVKKSV